MTRIRPCALPLLSSVVLLLLAGDAAALPDLRWTPAFAPIGGSFNRDEATRVRLIARMDGVAGSVGVAWALREGERVLASGDTLAAAARRGRETIVTLPVPALPPGSYLLDVTIDPRNRIEEKDEGNNRSGFPLVIPNGAAVRIRCEGPEGSLWDLYRVEINTITGSPYPDQGGTRPDTTRSTREMVVVNGVEPGRYTAALFGPSVNREMILIGVASFEMPSPPQTIDVVQPRTTPYIVGRPKIRGESESGLGGESAAPRWKWNVPVSLEGSVRNPTDRFADVQWRLRFVPRDATESSIRDTTISIGALATEKLFVTGRIPKDPGNYMIQAEVQIPWPSGFEDLGDDFRVASHVLPLGWIEVQR